MVFAYTSNNSYLGFYDATAGVYRNDKSPWEYAGLTEVDFTVLKDVRSIIPEYTEDEPANIILCVTSKSGNLGQDLNWASLLEFFIGTVKDHIADIEKFNDQIYDQVEYNKSEWTQGFIRANTGAIDTNSSNYLHSEFIKVSSLAEVRYTGYVYNFAGIAGYSAANTESFVTSILDRISDNDGSSYTDYLLTIPDTVHYIVACTMSSHGAASVSVKFNKIDEAYSHSDVTTDYSAEIEAIQETLADNKELHLTSVSLFPTIGVIGDSFSSGGVTPTDGSGSITNHYSISWPQIMARQTGCDIVNYTSTGADISRFLNENYSTAANWNIVKLEADDPRSLYIIYMGINSEKSLTDGTTVVDAGTIDDIKEDYSQNEDTFAGHYGQLVDRIIAHAPSAKLILVAPKGNPKTNLIHQIAEHYGIGFIKLSDHWFYSTTFYTSHLEIGHPLGIVYAGMANAFQDQIAKCMVEYDSYFSNVRG